MSKPLPQVRGGFLVSAPTIDDTRYEVVSLLQVLKELGDYTREDAEGILDQVYGEEE